MSRAQAGEHEVFGAAYERMGRCASCRFSMGADLAGPSGLVCAKWGKARAFEPVRAHWTCASYEYEPGALA